MAASPKPEIELINFNKLKIMQRNYGGLGVCPWCDNVPGCLGANIILCQNKCSLRKFFSFDNHTRQLLFSAEKDFKCETCDDKVYHNRRSYRKHMLGAGHLLKVAESYGADATSFPCKDETCQKVFPRYDILIAHSSHHGQWMWRLYMNCHLVHVDLVVVGELGLLFPSISTGDKIGTCKWKS